MSVHCRQVGWLRHCQQLNQLQQLSFLRPEAEQFTRTVQVSSVQASRCILIWLQALCERLHLRLVQRAPLHETLSHDLYVQLFNIMRYYLQYVYVFSTSTATALCVCVHLTHYILSVLTRPSSYAKFLSCKQSHNECPDVGLHYCFGSLACLNGCLKPSYTAVKNNGLS